MASFIIMIITLLFGLIVGLIYGRQSIKKILLPLLILLIGNFLFLYAKFAVGDSFLTLLYYLPASALVVISVIWFIIFLIVDIRREYNKNNIFAIFFSFSITAIIVFIPSLTQENKYEIYQKDYFRVAEAIFQAYDEGKISVGDQYHAMLDSNLNIDKLEAHYTEDIIHTMKKLKKNAGVYTYIVADQDVIYFSFGAFFQSISGIAITRNDRELSSKDEISSRFFDGATTYRYIEDNVYYFFDGL